MILSKILINSILYWRGTDDEKETRNFINKQISFLGKFGYYKSRIIKTLNSVIPRGFFSKFDFLH